MKIDIRKKRWNLIRMVSIYSVDFRELISFRGILGEPIVEPEVDLSNFLERQRLADDTDLPTIPGVIKDNKDDEDVDTTLSHISSYSRSNPQATSKKGKLEQIIWDEEIDRMNRDKKAAEATWGMIISFFLPMKFKPLITSDLKTRFRAKSEKIRSSPATRVSTTSSRSRKPGTLSKFPLSFIYTSLPAHIVMNENFRLSRRSCPSLTRRCSAQGPDAGNGRFPGRSANLKEAV